MGSDLFLDHEFHHRLSSNTIADLKELIREFIIHAEGRDVTCEFCGAVWSSIDQCWTHTHGCLVNRAKIALGDEHV